MSATGEEDENYGTSEGFKVKTFSWNNIYN